MPRFAYVNGRYVAHAAAAVHIEDRGYQFADAVYEVVPVVDGKMIGLEPHLDRLDRSLGEIRIEWPVSRSVMAHIARELIRRNGLATGLLYIQVSRGVAPRDHCFPDVPVAPALVMTTRRKPRPVTADTVTGVRVVTTPDLRWKRCDIKTTSLLPNVLARQQAIDAGAAEAWMVGDDGTVTEGTSSNAWIVTADGMLVTRPAAPDILDGITRRGVIEVARRQGLGLEQRAFTVAEALAAREALLTSSSNFVMPVVRIDDADIGDGTPGPLARAIRRALMDGAEAGPFGART